jgi:hypothetical protein
MAGGNWQHFRKFPGGLWKFLHVTHCFALGFGSIRVPLKKFARGLPLTSWYRLQGVGHLLVLLPQDIAQRVLKDQEASVDFIACYFMLIIVFHLGR